MYTRIMTLTDACLHSLICLYLLLVHLFLFFVELNFKVFFFELLFAGTTTNANSLAVFFVTFV